MTIPAPSITAQNIGPLLSGWSPGEHDWEEHPTVRWYPEVVFDHDYTHHLLVRQWEWDGTGFLAAGFSLWYLTDDVTMFISEWPRAERAPLIAAAAAVSAWETMLIEAIAP